MSLVPFVRREHKTRWEGRAPLSPAAVRALTENGLPVWVERYPYRCYDETAYAQAGARIREDDRDARLVLGIKEPKLEQVQHGQVHLCFSHTIKGQSYNMPLLQRFLDQRATLIDYELMKDVHGRRTIAFGRFAGIAGAIDTLHIAGRKWAARGQSSTLESIHMTHAYNNIATSRRALRELDPHSGDFKPRVLINGTGNVARGSIEVCEWLGLPRIYLADLSDKQPPGPWFAVTTTHDIVQRLDDGEYDKVEYRRFGKERYRSNFDRFLGRFDILLQTPFWTNRYPQLISLQTLRDRRDDLPPVIGDISCDIQGSIACTLRESTIEEPAYTYDLDRGDVHDGIGEEGPTVMAIGHLPSELNEDATDYFSSILFEKMPQLTDIDLDQPLDSCGLRRELREATIVYKGELTPEFAYLSENLARARASS